jgi:hypothetical protein
MNIMDIYNLYNELLRRQIKRNLFCKTLLKLNERFIYNEHILLLKLYFILYINIQFYIYLCVIKIVSHLF